MFQKRFPAIAALIGASFLFSCKEQPAGIFTGENAVDSTYVTSVEPVQTKNYYIEEFSGVRCPNCPAGAAKLEDMMAQNPNRLKLVTIHAGALTSPRDGVSKQDLRSGFNGEGDGLLITNLIYGGDPSKPAASFDRMPVAPSNALLGNKDQWDGMLAAVKTQNNSAPINMYLTSTYDAVKEEYNIQVKLAYTQSISGQHFLTIYLTEDKIIDEQLDPEIHDFEYNHVFRQSITPFNGIAVLDSIPTKEAGRVLVSNYKLKIDRNDATNLKQKFWNLDNIHVVAFVHKSTGGTDKKVYQVIDGKLKP